MINGVLVAESLKPGSAIDGVPLLVTKISRNEIRNATGAQPGYWTLIEFEAEERYIDILAEMLSEALDRPGWYADFRSNEEAVVVFPGNVFRYARGDRSGRAQAEKHARTLGIPESQLDWPE